MFDFTLSDQQAVRAQALREAVLRAKADAGVLAATLDLKVLRIISVRLLRWRGAVPAHRADGAHGRGEGPDADRAGNNRRYRERIADSGSQRCGALVSFPKPQHTGIRSLSDRRFPAMPRYCEG